MPILGTSASANIKSFLGPNVFVATTSGNGGANASTSTDGITWTQRTLPSSANFSQVAYGNSTIVAINADRYSPSDTYQTNLAVISTDGITWTERTLPTSTNWTDVTYGNQIFLAVSRGHSTQFYASPSTVAATSTDGTTWTQRTVSAGHWRTVTYGQEKFVAIDGYYGDKVLVSTDGVTFTTNNTYANELFRSIVYGNDVFLAFALYETSVILRSTDAITWAQATLPAANNNPVKDCAYGNGEFIAATQGDVSASTDGITWTLRTTSNPGGVRSIAFGPGKGWVVTTVYSGTGAASSTDGITWTNRTITPSSPSWWSSVIYAG